MMAALDRTAVPTGKRKNETPWSVVQRIWKSWAKQEAAVDEDPQLDEDDPDLIAKKGQLESARHRIGGRPWRRSEVVVFPAEFFFKEIG